MSNYMDIAKLRELIDNEQLPEWHNASAVPGFGWCATWEVIGKITVHYSEVDGWRIYLSRGFSKSIDLGIDESKALDILKAYMHLDEITRKAMEA